MLATYWEGVTRIHFSNWHCLDEGGLCPHFGQILHFWVDFAKGHQKALTCGVTPPPFSWQCLDFGRVDQSWTSSKPRRCASIVTLAANGEIAAHLLTHWLTWVVSRDASASKNMQTMCCQCFAMMFLDKCILHPNSKTCCSNGPGGVGKFSFGNFAVQRILNFGQLWTLLLNLTTKCQL